jgi:glycosyltransferase involved in cell wall biosynthesis
MKFTLAIISYNAQDSIRKCLDSCINQSYKDLDIIVVDDNSSDNTVKIIKEYQAKDKRINLIQHEVNKSALQARKTAVQHAKSQYVWFIDSDDNVEPTAIGEISRALKKSNLPDMLTFGSNDYYENGELKRIFYDWGQDKALVEWKADSDYRPYTRVTKKSVLEKMVKLIPDDLYLYRHNDFFMFNLLKLFVSSKEVMKRPLYNYTLSSSSVTNQKDKQSVSRHIDLIDNLLSEYKKSASQARQKDISINTYVTKERKKLTKYVIQQYRCNPSMYLHTLKGLYNYKRDIVISLTTYSQRIQTVHATIQSLLNQSLSVDKIILWLDKDEINFDRLPVELKALVSDKFEIKFCPNYKSYKKLIPTLELYPEATIITFDDDIDYPQDQVEKLVNTHFENPENVITSCARNINVKDGELLPYSEWKHTFKEQVGKPLLSLIPIGVGGVLYPAGSLHKEVMNREAFIKLAPHGDDLWFKCMTLINDRKVIAINHGYNLSNNQIDGTQNVGLWQTVNEGTDSNYEQMSQIMAEYSVVDSKIRDDLMAPVMPNYDLISLLEEVDCLRKSEGALKLQNKRLLEQVDHKGNSKSFNKSLVNCKLSNDSSQIEFDEKWYTETYPDVLKSGLSAIAHYKKFGKIFNRSATQTISVGL